ncbi:MAG: hypothetical protein K0R72_730 [Clostridia bacterium]|jgi:hypothetical protein|nr:hypothetical protein [Clostridia bacterium]
MIKEIAMFLMGLIIFIITFSTISNYRMKNEMVNNDSNDKKEINNEETQESDINEFV